MIITSTPKGNNSFYTEWLRYIINRERKEKLKKLMNKNV